MKTAKIKMMVWLENNLINQNKNSHYCHGSRSVLTLVFLETHIFAVQFGSLNTVQDAFMYHKPACLKAQET